jgi:arylsulfatase
LDTETMSLHKRLATRLTIDCWVILACAAAFFLPFCTAHGDEAKPRPPHIVFLMADQFRGDCLGADGNHAILTPNLDRLAAEGARFSAAYSTCPSCTPARAAILTGLGPWRHGQLGYGKIAERYAHEMPRMLRDAGYYAVGIGKMHYEPRRNTHGFCKTILDDVREPGFLSDYEQWFAANAPGQTLNATGIGANDHRAWPYVLPERLHPTRWTADEAIRLIEQYDNRTPLFLKVSFVRPHSPYDPPPRWWDRYAGVKLPPAAIGDWAECHAQRGQPHRDDLWQGDLGPEAPITARRGYYANVTFLDEQIGRILAALTKRGMLENSLILFTADHGDMLGDHHLWRKTYAYEPSARIPMLIRWPGGLLSGRRGQAIDAPVELRDLLPTFLDAAGVAFDPKWFDGRSLLPLLRGQRDGWRRWIDLEHAAHYAPGTSWTGLTDGRVKYIFYANDGREQLFDLAADPHETHNLAGVPAQRPLLETWRQRMVDHLAERGAPFVVGGKLAVHKQNVLYSPNYPGTEKSGAGPRGKRQIEPKQ